MRVIITGATGMVGKGVLLEALDAPEVAGVLAIVRSSTGIAHPKLAELQVKDFGELPSMKAKLAGYDACYHCMGVTSAGMSEPDYTRITYEHTLALAEAALSANPGLVFTYVSGVGTDSTEKGRSMWARVKGRTENTLLEMPFRAAYMFRPGLIIPERGIVSRTGWYRAFYAVLTPFLGMMKRSESATTTTRIGHAMLEAALATPEKRILEPQDINALAASYLTRRS
ncbi:MAG TPA: NAD-dependent epimerase/dehydratase family protein [Candidatus Thermoplasmatota archaeon]|nr:NAD-dependent epimerase/dehydratase family protein [Candidatus Thermoplasmatota archaeon]